MKKAGLHPTFDDEFGKEGALPTQNL